MDRNKQIDGLRGIAILLVMFSHFFSRFPALYADSKVFPLFQTLCVSQWGALGVAIFFLISGFFMVPSKPVTRVQYILKRVLRIWPIYVVAVVLCFIVTHSYSLPERVVDLKDLALNICFINGFIGTPYVDHAHWYLTYLLGATVIFSLLYDKSPNVRHGIYWLWLLFDLFLCNISVKNHILHLMQSGISIILCGQYAPIIILGATLADLKNKHIDKRCILTVTLCIITKVVTSSIDRSLVMFMGLAMFIPTFIQKRNALGNKALVFLGEISFSTYLIHQNIGYVILLLLCNFFGGYYVWMSFSVLILCLLLGALLHVVEKGNNQLLQFVNTHKKIS